LDQATALRARAASERAAAAACSLQNRRAMHERAAEAWEIMALQLEDTAARTLVNEAAKAAR
jgi:hypothetical protein